MCEPTVVPERVPDGKLTYISEMEAHRLGYGSRSTLHRWAQEGSVRSINLGTGTMIAEEDIKAKIAERKVLNVASAYEVLAHRVAQLAPVFSAEQKKQLVELLSA